ncbi:MAG: hypothetical protein MUE40_01415 [Anaerolineae bacterium]|jgi:hypothetical protein|nr:hypothetical protein [Anaerolineae bacterium]
MQRWLVMMGLLLCAGSVAGQSACPAIVETALAAVDTLCAAAGRNEACYGNVALTAEAQPDAVDFRFQHTGDIVSVSAIRRLTLQPMDEAAGVWGLVVMRLQADIPETLPGQNVTFVLFGDVTLENAAAADQAPMQAFYLTTGIGDAPCEAAPDSGLLVQTPDGVESVTFNVNGVAMEVGSTVLLQATAADEMLISPVEGAAVVTLDAQSYPVIAGARLRIPLGRDLRPAARPPLPEAYGTRDVQGLPVGLLPRGIGIVPPLAGADVQRLHDRLNSGRPPCGEAPFPPCRGALRAERWPGPLAPVGGWGPPLPPRPGRRPPADERPCVFAPRPGDPPLPADETRPLCPTPPRPRR